MEILVVGAGAVGSVYGYFAAKHSEQHPANITFLVKPKHRDGLKDGLMLYHWKGRKAESIHFKNFEVIDSVEKVSQKKFDVVLITLPSDKIREPGWMESLLRVIGEAKIWSLQPNLSDRDFIREKLKEVTGKSGEERLVFGGIPIMSYLAPLPGEDFEKTGYAFFIPAGMKAMWSSQSASEAKTAMSFFHSHGFPSKIVPLHNPGRALPESFLRCLVAGLEKSEWSLDRLINGSNLPLVTEGMRELCAIQAKINGTHDTSATFVGKIASSAFGVRMAVRVIKFTTPFDLEAFLRVHFTKVETQMHSALAESIEAGKKKGLSTTNLSLLRGKKRINA